MGEKPSLPYFRGEGAGVASGKAAVEGAAEREKRAVGRGGTRGQYALGCDRLLLFNGFIIL